MKHNILKTTAEGESEIMLHDNVSEKKNRVQADTVFYSDGFQTLLMYIKLVATDVGSVLLTLTNHRLKGPLCNICLIYVFFYW